MRMYPALSSDGERMAASDQDLRTLSIYDTRDFSKPLEVVTAPVEPKLGILQTHDWSGDGRSFLVVAIPPTGTGPNLWIYTVETKTARRVGDCAGPTWMKDGRRLVCVVQGGRVVAVDASSGRVTSTGSPLVGFAPGGVRLAMDDTQLYFLSGSQSADIWVARFGTPERSPLARCPTRGQVTKKTSGPINRCAPFAVA